MKHTEEGSTDARRQKLAPQKVKIIGNSERGCEMNLFHMIKEIKQMKIYIFKKHCKIEQKGL